MATALSIEGRVERPCQLTLEQLLELPAESQVEDVRAVGAKREGRAVRLSAVLAAAAPLPTADHLGLHASADDFHASIPLGPVRERAVLIYAAPDGQPLSAAAGGPFRLFIPDHAACHVDEIDECANVKFVDRIELTEGKGFDNRPEDDAAHEALHEKQGEG